MLLKIIGKNKKAIGYLHHNMIVSLELDKLEGVVLGSCVFNTKAELVARMLKSKLCNEGGYIVATVDVQEVPAKTQSELQNKFMDQAWQLITNIKDHSCCWTNEKQEWAPQNFSFVKH